MDDSAAIRRRLCAELKHLRAEANLTQRAVAEALDWSPSKIIRIENGSVAIGTTDLRALVNQYGLTDENKIDELVTWARASKRLPFRDYRDVLAPELLKFYGHEASASGIRQFEPLVLPGLLQIEAYTRALVAAHGIDDNSADKYIQSRRERQQLFKRPDPPELTFILDESVLLRPIGGNQVIREQFDHLLDVALWPNVSIQILPLRVGAHPGLAGPIVLLEFPSTDFPSADSDLVFIELPLTIVDDPALTSSYREIFWELAELATPPKSFPTHVEKALRTMRDQHES